MRFVTCNGKWEILPEDPYRNEPLQWVFWKRLVGAHKTRKIWPPAYNLRPKGNL